MIQFSINSFSNGLSGYPYNSIKDAIKDGSYSVWCNQKIKLAFSFGNGTEKDFKRYCKDNKCKIVSEIEKELYPILENESIKIGTFKASRSIDTLDIVKENIKFWKSYL